MTGLLQSAAQQHEGATEFGKWVNEPQRYRVAEFDGTGRVTAIAEKPEQPRSKYAVTGSYFYDNQVAEIAAHLRPSPRGELEITDVNNHYLQLGQLHL